MKFIDHSERIHWKLIAIFMIVAVLAGGGIMAWQYRLSKVLSQQPRSCGGDWSYQAKCPLGSSCKSLNMGPYAGGICKPFLFSLTEPYPTNNPTQKKLNTGELSCSEDGTYYDLSSALTHGEKACSLSLSGITKLPPEIFKLRNLKELHITATNHVKSLPPEIGSLVNLTVLDLMFNEELQDLPLELFQLQNLQQLLLTNNKLTSIPTEISKLKNLKILRLDNNQLTCLPSSIGELSSLEELHLGANKLLMLPPEVVELGTLQKLSIYHNPLILDQTPQDFLTPRYDAEDAKVWRYEQEVFRESAKKGEGITHLARRVVGSYLSKIDFFRTNPMTEKEFICLEDYLKDRTGEEWLKLKETRTFSATLLKEAFQVCKIKIKNICSQ